MQQLSKIELKKRAAFILAQAEKLYPDSQTELLNWSSAFQFLICVILSAQATDKGVNKVTPALFAKYPDSKSLSQANLEEVKSYVKSLNFFNNKAKNILNMAIMLESDFNGVVPNSLEELVKLPGVGYKTANVVLGEYFHLNLGIAVDTHVMRVVSRLDLVSESVQKDPTKIAKELEGIYEKEVWREINSRLVLFGRYVCKAKKPECSGCTIRDICTSIDKNV